MTHNLRQLEMDLIIKLKDKGLSGVEATLIVIMITRQIARPEQDLLNILAHYPSLGNQALTYKALKSLISKQWLHEEGGQYMSSIRPSSDIVKLLTDFTGDENIHGSIELIKSQLSEPFVRVLGATRVDNNHKTLLELLRNAVNEICMPMLTTKTANASAPIIKELANRGVKTRILLAAPEVVAQLRGEIFRKDAVETLHDWKKYMKGVRKVQIKVAHQVEDMLLASSVLIDNKIFRFDIYDPFQQRSLDGELIELSSPSGRYSLNAIALAMDHFNNAWRRAEPTYFFGRLFWRVARAWRWYLFVISLVFYLVIKDPLWTNFITGIAATWLLSAIVESWQSIVSFFRRIFSAFR